MKKSISVRTTNEIWAAAMAMVVIVYLCTFKVGGDKSLTDYLNFALALSSLILSLVGIVMSLFGSSEMKQNVLDIREASESSRKAASTVSELTDTLSGNFSKLIEEISSSKKITLDLSEKMELYTNQKTSGSTASDPQHFSIRRFIQDTSNYGRCVLYAAKLSEISGKSISLREIEEADTQYFIGYVMACLSAQIFSAYIDPTTEEMNVNTFPEVDVNEIKQLLEKTIEEQKKDPTFGGTPLVLEKIKKYIERHFNV